MKRSKRQGKSSVEGSLNEILARKKPEFFNHAIFRRRRSPADELFFTPYLYILPAFILFAIFSLFPLLHTAVLSFYSWNGLTPPKFVGLHNFARIFSDPVFLRSMSNVSVLILFFTILPVIISLIIAATMARSEIKGLTFFRTVLFLPQIIPLVVTAVAWRWIYAPNGVLNTFLQAIGAASLKHAWLGDFTWTLYAVGIIGTWVTIGLALILFLAGIQKIPDELYDAAKVDGAGPVAEFFAVTFPGIRNEVVVALVLTLTAAIRSFEIVFVTTGGGPGITTRVPALEVYIRAFRIGDIGSASAVGLIIAVVIFSFSILIRKFDVKE